MGRAGVRDPRGDPVLERRDAAGLARRGGASGADAATGARPAGTCSAAGRSTTTRSSGRRCRARRMRSAASPTDTFRAAAPPRRLSPPAHAQRRPRHGLPLVRLLGAIASSAAPAAVEASAPGAAAGVELDVPPYAQSIHGDEYPQYGGGGAAWCSPTSTAMVIGVLGRRARRPPSWPGSIQRSPTRASTTRHASPSTRPTTAPATGPSTPPTPPHFGLDAFVTRLRSLQEAELFLAAGIPLVASIAAGPGELDGFLLPQGTDGHLVVIVGFTRRGRPDRQRSRRRPRTTRCAAATTGRSSSAPGSTAPAERST